MTVNNDITQAEFDRIEKYLLGKMEGEEKEAFELELKANIRLKTAADDYADVITAVEAGAFKENLEIIHRQTIGTGGDKPKRNSMVGWLAIAAGIALLIGIGLWFFDTAPAADKLFAEYATKDPGLPVPMTGSTDDYHFHDAMVDYKAGKYALAIEKWTALLSDFEDQQLLKYYIASAHFNLEDYTEAVALFAEAETGNNDTYSYKSQWYTVLAQLKLHDTEAIMAVQPKPESPYAADIEKIKSQLK